VDFFDQLLLLLFFSAFDLFAALDDFLLAFLTDFIESLPQLGERHLIE
jgi:hypothetical protein